MSKEEKSEAAAFGFQPEDYHPGLAVRVWRDNWEVVEVFLAMKTQWRTGVGGVTGLDYNALRTTLRLMNLPRAKWEETFNLIRLMEDQALEEMYG